MKGLIGGILRGTGQTLQQIGTANVQANLEAEKSAAEDARQMRLLEVRNQYDTQRVERESELRLGNTVLDSQLRGELQKQELDARAKENQLNRDATLKSAQITASRGRELSPNEERELDIKRKRDAAIEAGDTAAVSRYDKMLGGKPVEDKLVEVKDNLGNSTFKLESQIRAELAGNQGLVNSVVGNPGALSKQDRINAALQSFNTATGEIKQPAQTSAPASPPRGDDKRGVESARKSQLNAAIAAKQRELAAVPNSNSEEAKQKAVQLSQEINDLVKERDKTK